MRDLYLMLPLLVFALLLPTQAEAGDLDGVHRITLAGEAPPFFAAPPSPRSFGRAAPVRSLPIKDELAACYRDVLEARAVADGCREERAILETDLLEAGKQIAAANEAKRAAEKRRDKEIRRKRTWRTLTGAAVVGGLATGFVLGVAL